ncbi:MAG: 16S rRNA (guanine(527)-N(7))-methyltransferase RsmG [Chitinivibrionales bacterium]|nr:16S rRNA (guanine(527)-N(7))-methyltransferase RsmG [Chitinivibrionales bacterium]MBD3397398.1 16S rRNA (guanine(527)-N(7))-methyltransferase RsmG [Chitinivibrionales bacterium]
MKIEKGMKSFVDRARKGYELKELERLGLTPELEQRDMILLYTALLLKWNKAAGLVSPKDESNIFIRHFCDSLQPLLLFGFKKNARVLDIGSGGGFPSIPVRIFRSDLSFVLAESNRKKCTFLKEVRSKLGLDNVEIFCGRVERLPKPSGKFDYVVSRGVGTLSKFSSMAKPFVLPDGRMYTFKAKQFQTELEEITSNKKKDHVAISEIAEYDLANQILGLNLVSLSLLK